MRNVVSKVHGGLAWVVVAAIVAQFFLAEHGSDVGGRPMNDARMSPEKKGEEHTMRPTETAATPRGDREAEAVDARRMKISPADLAAARAIIDAALARRS